jgi:DNA mismatch repair protein MutS2
MRNLSQQTETKLGFDVIRQKLEQRAATEQGKILCQNLHPFAQSIHLLPELSRVEECRDLLRFDESFSLDFTGDVTELLGHAAIGGNWLQTKDFFVLLRWLRMVRDLITYFSSRAPKYPNLSALVSELTWNKNLLRGIEAVIDERGNIKDNASSKLQALRKEQQQQSAELRKSMHSILRHASGGGAMPMNSPFATIGS